jgi:hypothetical protein
MVTIVVCKFFSLYFYVRYFQFYFCIESKKNHSDRCNKSIECIDNVGLVCSQDEKSLNKICECDKKRDSELYWHNGKCRKPSGYKSFCNETLLCRTKTQGTFCDKNSKVCQCKNDEYFGVLEKCSKLFIK